MNINEPVEELKETKLWSYLNNIDKEYGTKAIVFVKEISPILSSINTYFPYYTRHDSHHGYRILLRMNQILKEQCFDVTSNLRLTAPEAYLLICAAYAHDLGMAVFPEEKEKLLTDLEIIDDSNWKTNPRLQEYLRKNHSARGGMFIKENYDKLEVPLNLVSLINELMRSHNLSIHDMEVQLGVRVAAGEKEVDLKQLACIVCISDAIEFSETRVVDGVLEKLKYETGDAEHVSYRENMKHVCIGDSVAIGNDGRLIFSGAFTDPDILNLAHKTIDQIESWTRQYCEIDIKSEVPRLRLNVDTINRNLNIVGIDFERLGIRIKKENIINLISSNSTWSNDIVLPIKELLQNSVEACRYRKFNTPESRNYQPEIILYFDKTDFSITVYDNGCGMSKNIILNNFLTVGNSRSNDLIYNNFGYSSLARFGIGFWSVFTISSEVIVETAPYELLQIDQDTNKKVDGNRFTVSIEEFKDYTVFEPQKIKCGTKITLKLKDNININDILARVENIVICSEIPIKVMSTDGICFALPLKPQFIKDNDFFGAKMKFAKDNNVEIFKWEFDDSEIQFIMSFAYRKESDKAKFLLADNESSMLFIVDDSIQHARSGICGFDIPIPIENLPIDISRIGYFIANVLNPNGFKFSLDRKSLLHNVEVEKYSAKIMNLIVDGYRRFLKENNSYDSESIYNLNLQSRMHGGNVYDSYTKNKLLLGLKNYPDLVCYKLYRVIKGLKLSDAEVIYKNIEEIMKMTAKIWTCQTSASSNKLSTGHYISDENLVPVVYNTVANISNMNDENYIIEPCIEGSMLFDNDIKAEVYSIGIQCQDGEVLFTNIMKISTETLEVKEFHNSIIGEISGRWTGAIYETDLHSNNSMYEFIGRYRLVICKDSKLAKNIKEMYLNGKHYELVKFIRLLQNGKDGYIDDNVKEFMM